MHQLYEKWQNPSFNKFFLRFLSRIYFQISIWMLVTKKLDIDLEVISMKNGNEKSIVCVRAMQSLKNITFFNIHYSIPSKFIILKNTLHITIHRALRDVLTMVLVICMGGAYVYPAYPWIIPHPITASIFCSALPLSLHTSVLPVRNQV